MYIGVYIYILLVNIIIMFVGRYTSNNNNINILLCTRMIIISAVHQRQLHFRGKVEASVKIC